MTIKYPSIKNLRKRDMTARPPVLTEAYESEEVTMLADNKWLAFEKLDGTNIRLWNNDDGHLCIRGRTDRAQIPTQILDFLLRRTDILEKNIPPGITLYGEGIGPGIQNGGAYGDPRVVLFDAQTCEGRWLRHDALVDIADRCVLSTAPLMLVDDIYECEALVRDSPCYSRYGAFKAEGLVCKPAGNFLTETGDRIIVKIKSRDYPSE